MVEYCKLCGSYKSLEIHHIKPIAEGGSDIPENKVVLCESCHSRLVNHPYQRCEKGQNRSNIGTFYLGDPYRKTWQDFRAISIREGTTASKKIVEFIQDYVSKHGEGNPQTLLEYAGKPKTLPLWKTCKSSNGVLVKGEFRCTRDGRVYHKSPRNCEAQNEARRKLVGFGCYVEATR